MIPSQPAAAEFDTVGRAASRSPQRVVPHDTDAEVAVLGSLMLDVNAMSAIRDILDPADFYAEKHGHIYRAAAALSDRGEPLEPLSIRAELERTDSLQRAGGVEYISDLPALTPSATSVRYYAEVVIAHSVRRRLISAGGEVSAIGFNPAMTVEEAVDTAEQAVFNISDQRRTNEAQHIGPILKETWTLLEKTLNRQSFITGVQTNFKELDKVTQGLQPGELVILAARPSVGKTSFALNLARNAAVLAGNSVVVFSLEMTAQSLVQRLICSEAGVDSFLLKTGQATNRDFEGIAKAMDRLSRAKLFIDDTPSLNISAMRARSRRMKAQHDIQLIVVDYLQIMHGGRQESRVQEVSDISAGLKSIAKELNVPVLALSQLSRESERRENRKPQLSDLRDSGCLTAESPVLLADEHRHAPISTLVGRSGFEVIAVDPETLKLERATVSRAFPSGVKDVFTLATRLGTSIRASANHRFLTTAGWKRLDELTDHDHVARPRHADGDVSWDKIDSIVPDGREETFDLTIEGLHNFVAADILVHNSIEQDADVVLFLYRPGMRDPEQFDKSVTELLVAKNRNGPTTEISLHFHAEQTTFREPYPGGEA